MFTGSLSPVTGVNLYGLLNDQPYTLQLFDDGNHNDSLSGDKIYGNFIRVFQEGDLLMFRITMQTAFDTTTTKQIITACAFPDVVKSIDIRTGRIILPIDNRGNLADVATASGGGMRYDSIVSIFSQGFMLSGLIESSVWAAGVFSTSLIKDFQVGKVGYPIEDPKNGIYQVALSDSAFGTSWQRWKGAVSLGARYWDGNNNNIYDPIDLNQNGTWELNEDMPEILGEVSYFTVFNDGVDVSLRRYLESPKGIEIRQTIYAFPDSDSPAMQDAVFIRYEIVKKGNLSPKIDDIIFWNSE
ncbi:MAG: hypothetical protein IPJ75_14880 [Ignavibacteriales bacterium]|nr:hypothetical protein [Ignavibacteriales bacterium]